MLFSGVSARASLDNLGAKKFEICSVVKKLQPVEAAGEILLNSKKCKRWQKRIQFHSY